MSSFEDVDFTVITDGFFANDLARDSSYLRRFTCTAEFDSITDLDAMQAYITHVDVKQVLGTLSFNAHVQAGYGSGLLNVFVGRNHTRGRTAFLVGVSNVAGTGRYPYRARATLEFIMLT